MGGRGTGGGRAGWRAVGSAAGRSARRRIKRHGERNGHRRTGEPNAGPRNPHSRPHGAPHWGGTRKERGGRGREKRRRGGGKGKNRPQAKEPQPKPQNDHNKPKATNRGKRRWPALVSRQGAIAEERTILASHSFLKQKRAVIRGKNHRPRAPKRRREEGKPGSQKEESKPSAAPQREAQAPQGGRAQTDNQQPTRPTTQNNRKHPHPGHPATAPLSQREGSGKPAGLKRCRKTN